MESIPETNSCMLCGKVFPIQDLLPYENGKICTTCKPDFVQKLKEGGDVLPVGVWRSGRRIVMHMESRFPSRCIKCNAPADPATTREASVTFRSTYPLWLPAFMRIITGPSVTVRVTSPGCAKCFGEWHWPAKLYPVCRDGSYLWLRGARAPFLDSLPSWD